MSRFAFRHANDADLDRLVEIHMSAFPDARGAETRARNFARNALGELSDAHVAEQDGVIVAHAFLFALEVWFGGVRVKAGGIASVGVAPEARGTGAGSALLDHLHDASNARGEALTILYAFRQGYYARKGYAPASSTRRLSFSPRAVPASWSESLSVRAATGADRAAIERLHLEHGARTTGCLARPERIWSARFLDERRRWFVCTEGDEIVGYVAWALVQPEPHAETSLIVQELVTRNDAARRRLFGLLGAQRDQVTRVELDVDESDPFDRALEDPDRHRFGTAQVEHVLGELVGGPMVRVGDVPRAIVARGYTGEGELTLQIDGESPLALRVAGGRARAFAVSSPGITPGNAPDNAPDNPTAITMDRAAFAAVFYGALRPSRAAQLGMLRGEAEAIARADALLALSPYFSRDAF